MTSQHADRKAFGDAVIAARSSKKPRWSQRRLAVEADISPTTLGEIERGEKDLDSPTVTAVASALGWPADAGARWLAGDRTFVSSHYAVYADRIDQLDEKGRRQLDAILDDLLGDG